MAQREEFVPTIKIILVGESSVGKTALLSRFLQGPEFDIIDLSATVGPTFKQKDFTVRGRKVKLELWDTAGMERFRSLTRSHYRGALGALLVYDASNPWSLTEMENWHGELRTFATDSATMVVANKVDMVTGPVANDGLDFSKNIGALYAETSASTGKGVDQIFEDLVIEILLNNSTVFEEQRRTHEYPRLEANAPPPPKKKGCCSG
ncbi:hypothetical protein M407DRAFT_246266 [Tulasnella calospora MUT 4182]|uniref:Uncharacterized protein n=1 Tax=Tulasnella calospora MUT 4182 TaxID=1051891 RepID=A0A0C3Q6W9_9AGAM|nr:hypothetical protein M407DRAFT_246266 [Tulasnella calospora MUT 4182]